MKCYTMSGNTKISVISFKIHQKKNMVPEKTNSKQKIWTSNLVQSFTREMNILKQS